MLRPWMSAGFTRRDPFRDAVARVNAHTVHAHLVDYECKRRAEHIVADTAAPSSAACPVFQTLGSAVSTAVDIHHNGLRQADWRSTCIAPQGLKIA